MGRKGQALLSCMLEIRSCLVTGGGWSSPVAFISSHGHPHLAPRTSKTRSHSSWKSSTPLLRPMVQPPGPFPEKIPQFCHLQVLGEPLLSRLNPGCENTVCVKAVFINFSPHMFLSCKTESVKLWQCSCWICVTGHVDPRGASRMKTRVASLGKNPLLHKQDVFPPSHRYSHP